MEEPAYEPLIRIAEGVGARVVPVPRDARAGFALDPERIARAMTPRTRAVVVTNLHNPSGVRAGDDDLRAHRSRRGARGRVPRRRRGLCGVRRASSTSAASSAGARASSAPNVVAVSSLTKCYGLGPERIGWLLGPKDVIERAGDALIASAGMLPRSHARVGLAAFSRLPALAARSRKSALGQARARRRVGRVPRAPVERADGGHLRPRERPGPRRPDPRHRAGRARASGAGRGRGVLRAPGRVPDRMVASPASSSTRAWGGSPRRSSSADGDRRLPGERARLALSTGSGKEMPGAHRRGVTQSPAAARLGAHGATQPVAVRTMTSLLHVFGDTFPAFGASLLLGAMVVASYTFAVALAAGANGRPRTLQAARFGAYGTVAMIGTAVVCLAYAFVTHDFRIRYVAHYSDRSMPLHYLFTALWGGQDGSLLWWLFLLSAYIGVCVRWLGQAVPRASAVRHRDADGHRPLLLHPHGLRREPVRDEPGRSASGRRRSQPGPAELLDGDPPAVPLHGLRRVLGPVRVRGRRARHRPARSRVDRGEPQVDPVRVDVPRHREHARHALGVRVARLGRLLGMGPRRERGLHAVPGGQRLRALGDDPGAARPAQGLERLPRRVDVLSHHLRHVPHALRDDRERPRVRAVVDRQLLRRRSWCSSSRSRRRSSSGDGPSCAISRRRRASARRPSRRGGS